MKKIIQHILPAFALLGVAATGHAADDMGMKSKKAGFCFMGGIEGGYTNGTSDVKLQHTGTPAQANLMQEYYLGGQGGHGGILLGAGYAFHSGFGVGVEASGRWGKSEAEWKGAAGNIGENKLTLNDQYGVALCAGYRMHGACPFLKAGYTAGRWESKFNAANHGTIDKKEFLHGFTFGAGIDMMVMPCVSVGMGWDYTWYEEKKYNTTATPNAVSLEQVIKPRSAAARVQVKMFV